MTHPMHRALAAAALLVALPATAQDLRPESVARYGGTYSTDCRDRAAPRVQVGPRELAVVHGAKALRTPLRMDSYTSFGAAPTSPVPEGYRVEFIGDDFSVHVFEDARGLHVPLAGHVPAAEQVVGRAATAARFGRCASRAALTEVP